VTALALGIGRAGAGGGGDAVGQLVALVPVLEKRGAQLRVGRALDQQDGSLGANHARFTLGVESGHDRGDILGSRSRRDCRQPTGGIDDDRRRPRRSDRAGKIAALVDQRRRTSVL
jgi:hypothetical protein